MTVRRRSTLTTAVASALAVAGAAAAVVAPVAVAAAPPDPILGTARLAGTFQLAGRITTAVRVKGEHRGQNVLRTWSFIPGCQIGSCRTVGLLRRRSGGSDRIKLTRNQPGYYVGSGSFYAPLKCGGRTYRRGEAVPFTVTVTITAALRDPTGVLVATRVNATYTNKSRRNLTRCVEIPGHDAATYHGHVLIGSSSGGTGVGG